MKTFHSFDEVLDFAIIEEESACRTYMQWAEESDDEKVTAVFESMAREEAIHKDRLLELKAHKTIHVQPSSVEAISTTEPFIFEVKRDPETEKIKNAYKRALQKEKESFEMYRSLAYQVSDEDIKNTLLMMADEEVKHHIKLEVDFAINY